MLGEGDGIRAAPTSILVRHVFELLFDELCFPGGGVVDCGSEQVE